MTTTMTTTMTMTMKANHWVDNNTLITTAVPVAADWKLIQNKQKILETNTQIHKYKYTNTQIHKYTYTQIHKYTKHKYFNTPCGFLCWTNIHIYIHSGLVYVQLHHFILLQPFVHCSSSTATNNKHLFVCLFVHFYVCIIVMFVSSHITSIHSGSHVQWPQTTFGCYICNIVMFAL